MSGITSRPPERAHTRTAILLAAAVLFGIGCAALWFRYSTRSSEATEAQALVRPELTEVTRNVLGSIESPIEIRFYALLDPATTPAATRTFATRVDQLLSAMERTSNGKLRVVRVTSGSESATDAAMADGLKPINRGQGDPSYLGLSVRTGDQRETLPALAPEWDQALEPDLARAILRVLGAKAPQQPASPPPQSDTAIMAELSQAIPNLAGVSREGGIRILRENALAEFAGITAETEARVKDLQQHLLEAQRENSDPALQAAKAELQKYQAAQNEKLKEIASKLQSQIAALERIKRK